MKPPSRRKPRPCRHCGTQFEIQTNGPRRFCSRQCYIRGQVQITPKGCWEWQGCRNQLDYGQGYFHGERMSTHRISYREFNGPLISGLLIRHKCDNPPCCNPEHLVQGTYLENVQDMWARGRARPWGYPQFTDPLIVSAAKERMRDLLAKTASWT